MDNATAYKNLVAFMAWLKGFNPALYNVAADTLKTKLQTGLGDFINTTGPLTVDGTFASALGIPSSAASSSTDWGGLLNSVTSTVSNLANQYTSFLAQQTAIKAQAAAAAQNTPAPSPINIPVGTSSALSGLILPLILAGGVAYFFMQQKKSAPRRGR